MKAVALLAAGVALTAMVAPAHAQSAQSQPEGDQAEASDGLGVIVVTAQRREQNSQDVPVAITAADAGTLATARVENITNVDAISPSVGFRVSNIATSSANLIIRGLGTTGNSRTFEGSVGVFIDGVYRTRAAAALQNFLDIGDLQILRGPQGTLFGKNTTAGALLLNSARPTVNETEGLAEVTYGNFDSLIGRAAVNVPLGDSVAFRLAGMYSTRDGFYTDSTTGADLNDSKAGAIKGQLLFEGANDLSIRLIGDFSRSEANCCYATSDLVNGPTQPLINTLTRLNGRTVPSTRLGDYQATLNNRGNTVTKDYGATLLIDFPLGAGTLNSITALRKFTNNQVDADPDFSGADIFDLSESFKSKFFSQELTYNTQIDSIGGDLVLGGFYSNEKLDMTRNLAWASQAQLWWNTLLGAQGIPAGTAEASPGRWADEVMSGDAESFAAFAHLNAKLSDKIGVIAGLRYSVERKRGSFAFDFYRASPTEPFRLLGVAPGPAYNDRQTDKALSGTFGLQYFASDDVMAYATFNRGFKAGGINIDANGAGTRLNNPREVAGGVPLDPSFRPEKVNAYEVGMKLDYLDRRARTNISFFHYDISDIQVAQFIGLRFTVLNANSAKVWGAEIENLFELTDGLRLSLDATWLPNADFGTDARIDASLSGSRFRYAPKLKGNATLLLDQPISDTVNITGRLQYQYASSQLINTASVTGRGSTSLLNANIGFRLPESNLLVELWGLNLTKQVFPELSFNTPLQTGDENAYLNAPRTYGVRVRYEF